MYYYRITRKVRLIHRVPGEPGWVGEFHPHNFTFEFHHEYRRSGEVTPWARDFRALDQEADRCMAILTAALVLNDVLEVPTADRLAWWLFSEHKGESLVSVSVTEDELSSVTYRP